MKTFQVQHDCGCCFSDVQFEDRVAAEAEIKRVGLGNGMTIVDATGKVVENVDTFYGILDVDEDKSNSLGRLVNMLK
jgi:hypothetical protein